ncbi:MAG: DUF2922 domain-containing protein [Candidatus Cryosericum sp.]|nr:DUF2922 domain-containing protein [bacterium]
MATTQTTVLRLVFGTEIPGKTTTMEFNSPRPDLTDAQIRPVMQSFIDAHLVSGTNGLITSIEGADIVSRLVTDVIS